MDIQKLVKLIEERELLKPGQRGAYNCVVIGCTKESKFSRGEGIRKSLCEAHKNQLPDKLKQQFKFTSLLMCQNCNISRANYKNITTGKIDRCKKCLDKEQNPSNWISGKTNNCQYEGCTKEARYGPYMIDRVKSTRKNAVMCSTHKSSDHVDLTSRLCQGYNGVVCTQSNGKPATAKFVYAYTFKQHINDKNTKTTLTSKLKNPVPTHCLKCISKYEQDSVNVSNLCIGDGIVKCSFGVQQTPLQANWGIIKDGKKQRLRCYKHKLSTDISCSTVCNICNSMFASKDQMCCGCFNNSIITKLYNTYKNDTEMLYKKLDEMMTNKKLKTKETLVLQNLKLDNGIFQYQVHNPFCEDEDVPDKLLKDDYKTRGDMKYAIIDMYGYYKGCKIIIEVDENQHKTYPCDFLRMVKIFKSFQDNVNFVLIRINPDKFTINDNNVEGMFDLDDTGKITPREHFEYIMKLINDSINHIIEKVVETKRNEIVFINYDTNSKVIDDYKELAHVTQLYHFYF